MNTREREVMDALANALRGVHPNPGLSTTLAAYDALLAEGSASGEGAGVVDSAFNRPMFGRMIEADFSQNTATFEMEPGYYAAAGRFEIRRPQPAHGEQFHMSQAAADAAHSIKVGEVLTQEQWDGVCAFVREQDGIIRAFHEQRSCEGSERKCACGLATCVEPWEPGCGLGTSKEHAAAVASDVESRIGAAVAAESERRPIADEVVFPPLPEPADARSLVAFGPKPDYYTPEQMHAYAREAVRLNAHPRGLPAGSDAKEDSR